MDEDRTAGARPSRRRLLGASLVLGVGGGLWWLRGAGEGVPAALRAEMPSIDGRAPERGLPFITPNEDFYTFANRKAPPPLRAEEATLELVRDGRPESIPWTEIARMPTSEVTRTLQCVGNGKPRAKDFPWRWGGISNARWSVVPARAILERFGVSRTGPVLLATGRDGWRRGVEGDRVEQGTDIAIALAMNGELLPHAHGAPARLLVPGDFGEMHVKWLRRLAWSVPVNDQPHDLTVKPMAFATRPGWGSTLDDVVALEGISYAGPHPVVAVSVTVDGLGTIQAELLDPSEPFVWRRWRAELRPSPGWHGVRIAATDASGRSSTPFTPGQRWGETGQAATHDLALRLRRPGGSG